MESTLSEPSHKEVSKFLLWEDKTPVRKDEGYLFSKNRAKGIEDDFLYRHYWKNGLWDFDTFDNLISQFARHFMFAHCWTISPTEDILMWDRYSKSKCSYRYKNNNKQNEKRFC